MRNALPMLAALLAACSTPAYRASQVPVPSSYNASAVVASPAPVTPRGTDVSAQPVYVSSTVASTPFWTELGDTMLTNLVREAQRANMDVRIAESRLTSARASRRLAAFDLVPTLTGTGSSSRLQQSMAQVPGLTSQLPAQQYWDVGFDASWEIDFFGRVGRNVKAQSALVESSQHGLADLQVSVAAEVARTYFELRGAQRQLAVSLRNATNQREIVKLTENRLAAGSGTAFDTERAKSVLYLT
ncbi:MAG TPA: TolC family protein, partial [Gemmatimonadaceae bacterium]